MIFAVAAYSEYTNISSDDRPLYAVFTGLVLYNSSVLAEIVRAGILSLPKGQSEAAMAVGLRKNQVMRFILLPQAVTAMLPAIVSQLVVIVKDTAIGGAILTFPELLASVGPTRRLLRREHHRQLHRRGPDLHRAQLQPHELRELARGTTAARQEVDGRGACAGRGRGHGVDRRGRRHLHLTDPHPSSTSMGAVA